MGRRGHKTEKIRQITRRDFIHGVGAGGALLAFPSGLTANPEYNQSAPEYPPRRTGLRGAHPGSYQAAHELVRGKPGFQPPNEIDEQSDLVVIGAGISGLAAAHYYRQRFGADARILLLDNNDDFGGHARRNEFLQGGEMRLGIGGSQYLAHLHFSGTSKELMRELGVDIRQLLASNEFRSGRNGARGPAIWFDQASFGVNKLVTGVNLSANSGHDIGAAIDSFPLSDNARAQLRTFYQKRSNVLSGLPAGKAEHYLARTRYTDFLREHGGLNDEAIGLFQSSSHVFWGTNLDTLSIREALMNGSPGYHLLGEPAPARPRHAIEGFFPDGNASIARLLVSRLIPLSSPGAQADNIATAKFDYGELDTPTSPVRLRLNATALNVKRRSTDNVISYSLNGKLRAVSAHHCILACNHTMIPYICPEMSAGQKTALAYQVKVPLVITNVLLRSAEAFDQLGITGAYCPGRMHAQMYLLKGISSGGYSNRLSSQGPAVATFSGTIATPAGSVDVREGFRESRKRMMEMKFSDYEEEVRTVLQDMLGPAGFKADRDILAITVNRWPHGYSYEYRDLYDPVFAPGGAPHEVARRPWGNVSIANADAGASAYMDAAVDQAFRAVRELSVS